MRPGRLRAQRRYRNCEAQEPAPLLASSIAGSRTASPRCSSGLQPPGSPAPSLSHAPWLSASYWEPRRTLLEVADVALVQGFFFFFLFKCQPWVRLPKTPKGLLIGSQDFKEGHREGETVSDLRPDLGKSAPGPSREAEGRGPPKNAAGFL